MSTIPRPVLEQFWHLGVCASHLSQSVSFKEVKLYEPPHARAWGLRWAVSVYLQLLLLAANACQHGSSLQARSLCVGSMGTHFAPECSNLVGKLVRDTLRCTGAVVKS